MDENLRTYELEREKGDALGHLDKLLGKARRIGLHEKLGLPEPITTRYIEQTANYREMLERLLSTHMQAVEGQKEMEEERTLVTELVEGIRRVGIILKELKPRPPDSSPHSSPMPEKR